LNRAYFTFKTRQRPFVIMKAATSLDNQVAARPGERTEISSGDSAARARGSSRVDAIAVGSGTMLVDDPMLTVREIHRRRPLTRSCSTAGCGYRPRRGSSRRWWPDR
jgi:diaminohydroxyphosphoribosylaminopyrimidine deaminase/5-amino-6-(5-phosphoribosylamino)uracil reductase